MPFGPTFVYRESSDYGDHLRQHTAAYIRDASMQRLWNVCPSVLIEEERISGLSVDDFSFRLGSLKGRDVALNATLDCAEESLQDFQMTNDVRLRSVLMET